MIYQSRLSNMQVGIDLGGTKIEAGVLDASGQFLFRERLATPRDDYQATLAAIATLVIRAESALSGVCQQVGVGHPGSTNPATGLIRNANSTCLNGQALGADLEALLQRPVRMANDADCLALSEATDGVAKHDRSVFGVILGTGVGGGWVINRQLLQGPNGLAGEWGHNPLPVDPLEALAAPRCYCGKYGCVEAWLSGPALVSEYQRTSGNLSCLDVQAIVAAADAGDPHAKHILQQHTARLARAMAIVINLCDPEVIVLGGGVSQRPGLIPALLAALPAHVFLPPDTPLRTRILLPAFGDSSGVRGAARLA